MVTRSGRLQDASPAAVHKKVRERAIMLIDGREPRKYATERIDSAQLFPLSTFDPEALPSPDGRKIVFQCGFGERTAMAAGRGLDKGMAHRAPMISGIRAWKAAGLPTVR